MFKSIGDNKIVEGPLSVQTTAPVGSKPMPRVKGRPLTSPPPPRDDVWCVPDTYSPSPCSAPALKEEGDVEGAELAKASLAVGAAHHPLLLFGAAAVLGILSIVVITMLLLNVSSRCWGSSCAGCQQWYCVSTNTND